MYRGGRKTRRAMPRAADGTRISAGKFPVGMAVCGFLIESIDVAGIGTVPPAEDAFVAIELL